MEHLTVNGRPVTVERKANRHMYLRVSPRGELRITAPHAMPRAAIAAFLAQKAPWIERQLAALPPQADRPPLTPADRAALKELLPPLIAKWERALGVQVNQWGIRDMKTRWGSCNPAAGRVWFALMLLREPIELIDYVVLHELCHLLEGGHNQRFWGLVEHHMPDWKDRRRRLNKR